MKMETQNIVNLLNDSKNKSSKSEARKWYIINDQNNRQYGERNKNDSTIKFETKIIKPNLCDFPDAYILVTRNIAVTSGNDDTKFAFKNCTPFTRCVTHINDEHVQFKRDSQNMTDAGNPDNVTTDDSSSFKYKLSLLGKSTLDGAHGKSKDVKIVVQIKYLSNFFRLLEMPLINCKIHLEFSWTNICVMSGIAGDTTFKITSTKLYVPIVTLSTKDNVNLTKQLNEGFKRYVYWNEYKSKIETQEADANNPKKFPLDASFQGVNRLFVLALSNTDGANRVQSNSHRRYFLPRVDITNYNALIDGRSFYDQPINDQIRKYDEIRNIATGQEDDYTTGCLLDYQYFKNYYHLIEVDLSTQKKLDADPRATQQIEF